MSSNGARAPATKGTVLTLELRTMAAEFQPELERYFSSRVKNADEVEDLVHDTLVRLLHRSEAVDFDRIRGYVFQTANSVLVDWLRRGEVRHRFAGDVAALRVEDDNATPERVVAGQEELERVARNLRALPQRTRTVFVLRRLEGMKYDDIASQMGVSVSLVEKLMRAALTHLADCIQDEPS